MNQISQLMLFFIVISLFSIFFANLAHQIDLNISQETAKNLDLHQSSHVNYDNSTIGSSSKHLFWFMQISDLHLSIFHDYTRIKEFEEFCCSTVDVIQPSVILASGDLTDAKHKDNMGSGQYKEEWVAYAEILKKCKIRDKTFWLDIRGNHDNFNVPGWKSSLNYFRDYSIQGPTNPRTYMHVVEKDNERFAFIALDACLDPGPRRPFNFIGMLTEDNHVEVKRLLKNAEEMNVNHTIWFGHYPTSCILSVSDESLKSIIGNVKTSKAYLCGHLHQMGGLITNMYTLQKTGFLELELGDWKDNRMFRIAAIDHGLFSFVDVQHGIWPIILVTNPKNALYAMPEKEPLMFIKSSTHIRLLIFSFSSIASVEVKIGNNDWEICEHIEGPLYTLKWNPLVYNSGIHYLHVRAADKQGRQNVVEHPFSLDGSKMNFNILAKIVLMIDAPKIFQFLFGTMLMIGIIPLILIRNYHNKVMKGDWKMMRIKKNIMFDWLRKMWILSTVDRLFYPIILFEIYLCFGPWFVGEIIDGYLGAVFSWGLIVNGEFLPGSFTYVYGFLQLFICQVPLTLFLGNCVDKRFKQHWCGVKESQYLLIRLLLHTPFLLILTVNMVFAYFFWLAYGTIALLLGPLRTWSVFLNLYLWYQAVSLPPAATRETAKIWLLRKYVIKRAIHDSTVDFHLPTKSMDCRL